MDVSSVAGYSAQMAQSRASDTASLMMLKKAMDLQAESAMTLIDSVRSSASLPSHIGQNVNTVA
jgi:hypothetical protein